MKERGFRPRGILKVHDCLARCLDRDVLPQPNDILRSFLPRAAARGLIPRSPLEPVPLQDLRPRPTGAEVSDTPGLVERWLRTSDGPWQR